MQGKMGHSQLFTLNRIRHGMKKIDLLLDLAICSGRFVRATVQGNCTLRFSPLSLIDAKQGPEGIRNVLDYENY